MAWWLLRAGAGSVHRTPSDLLLLALSVLQLLFSAFTVYRLLYRLLIRRRMYDMLPPAGRRVVNKIGRLHAENVTFGNHSRAGDLCEARRVDEGTDRDK